MLNVKDDFLYLKKENTIYFDNSSTTLKPKIVIDNATLNNIYSFNSNRGNNKNVLNLNKKIEMVRNKTAKFINAKSSDEIAFTSGATESSNLIAYSYCLHNLLDNDEILLCLNDHKSTILPIMNIKKILKNQNKDIKIKEILIDYEGDYKENDLFEKITSKTKLVVLTHIHNMYGLEMNIEYIVKKIRAINENVIIVLDCAQSAGHINIDVQKLNIDIAYFSGHKMMSLQGIGVIYIKKEIQNMFYPFIIGGNYNHDEIKKISDIRDLECGTKNSCNILSLGDSIDYINSIGIDKIEEHIYILTRYLYDNLKKFEIIEFNKGINNCTCALGYGIISFKIKGISSSEVSEILEDYNIIVRTGNFCNASDNDNYIRVSLYIYNTKEEIDNFISVINYLVNEI